MFRIVRIRDYISIPPSRFGDDIEEVAKEVVRSNYEGKLIRVDGDVLLFLAVRNIKVSREGFVVPGYGETFHEVEFDALVYEPMRYEVVEGEVVNVQPYGIFVNTGPIDVFVHISAIYDDRFSVDLQKGTLIGERTRVVLSRGDWVRLLVTNVSVQREGMLRIAGIMKREGLGKIEWIKELREKKKKKVAAKR